MERVAHMPMVGTWTLARMALLVALQPLVAVRRLVAGTTIIVNTSLCHFEQFAVEP